MPKNLVINGPQDLNKLTDWNIRKAFAVMGQPPRIVFRITHPAASTPVDLVIVSTVSIGLTGNVPIVSSELGIQTRDVEEVEE